MRTYVKRLGFGLAVALAIMAPAHLYAACQIVGTTPDGGYIIVCDGPDTIGINSGDGSDIITINVGVDVTKTDLQSSDSTAIAAATTIDAGGGNNQVTNNGSIGANAGANALPVDGSASQATTNEAGIKAGDGADVIQNFSTITSTATSNSTSGDISITLGGNNQSQSMTTSTATAVGIDGGVGNNEITNAGEITVTTTSQVEALSVYLNVTDTAHADASVTAQAIGIGILGQGLIVNQQTAIITVTVTSQANTGNINANVGDSAKADANTKAEATATGIAGSGGNDTITSAGTITVEATSLSEGSLDLEGSTDVEINATIEAKSTAIGIDGGDGGDTINNSSTINTTSKATAKTDKLAASFWAPGVADTTVKSVSQAVGIMGSNGIDTVSNGGNIITHAEATTEVLNLLTSYGVEVALPTDIKGGATSDATAKGIDGGDHDDQITNHSGITATSEATTSSDGVLLTYVGIGTFATPTTATAQSIGIDGGKGADTISNNNQIDATATSTATALSVSVSGFQYEVKSDGDAKTKATAIATGIAGEEGDDRITSTGTITSTTNSTASTKDISAEYMGASKGNSSTTAEAAATGIDSGLGKDEIINSGTITVNATSRVNTLGIDVKRNDIPLDPVQWFGANLGNARTEAQAKATGIDGGEGDDTITNSGMISVSSKATASSYDIVAEVAIGSGSKPEKASSSSLNLEPPLVTLPAVGATAQATLTEGEGSEGDNEITNTGTIAKTYATGIAAGAGNDTITNDNKVTAKAESNANSLSIGVTISYERSEFLDLLGQISLTDSKTTTYATAVGIDGGVGNDTVNNTMEVNAEAISNASSEVIKAHLQADFSEEKSGEIEFEIGSALVKSGTVATAIATGIAGGDGDDTITNSGKIIVKATPDSDSASVAATLIGAESGLVVGFTYANAETTAKATAVGIDGGSGNDTITNTNIGQIEVTANPTSSSGSVSATITGVMKGKEKVGLAAGAALTDGTTKAIGNATGISGGEGDDTITNSGKIIVKSNPDADSASVSVTLGAALGELGLVGGFSYADATTTAEANAIGLEGGAGKDIITNTGEIEVTAEPTASSASIGVTAQGVKGMGAAVGISLTDGTTKAISAATGITGGEGDDTIANLGKITVKALPDADSASVSVSISAAKEGVAVGGTFADATTTAQATATGINGGEGNDTITNSGWIEVEADSESSSASVGVSAEGTMTGATLGVALSDGTTKAISNAAGIMGEGGKDTILNSSIIIVTSTANVASASVSVGLGGAETGLVAGVAAADVKSTAESTAMGISGGSGDDIIENKGLMMAVTATSTNSSASVSVNAGIAVNGAAIGVALADGKTVATSSAIGLEGGERNDTLTNHGLNLVSATSDVTAASVAVNLEGTKAGLAGGVSLVDGENRADALAIGISGGSGNDTFGNYGTTQVDATATSIRGNVSVTGNFSLYGAALGASFAYATNTAKADARGIEGGEGNDQITNTSDLVTGAKTTASTTAVTVDVNVAIFGIGAGASLASAETTGSALATGIDGGDGENTITNTSRGWISSTSNAYADTTSVSVNLLGYVKASADSTATATSIGMKAGKDTDSIQNDGAVTLAATSDIDASAYAVQLMGYGESSAKGISNATVKGIVGGDGINTLINIGSITGTATANGDVSSYDIQLSGGGKATAGTDATATAIGISGGKGMDTIRNEGLIDLTAQSTLVSESRSFKIFGVGIADADSKALVFATGIDGAEGPNTLINTGSITVSSNASSTATGVAADIGAAGASASTTSNAHSTGIKSGSGEDTIINQGILNVKAISSTYAGSGDLSLIGLSFGASITEAVADGIVAGDGKDVVTNSGTITVGAVQDNDHPMANSNVDSVSVSLFNISFASFGSTTRATGIIGGGGDDTITNTGTIMVGDDHWMAKGRAYGFSGQFFVFFNLNSVGATAEAVSTGIEGGDGNDTILNDTSALLTVKATSYAEAEGAADVTTFGSPAAFASSTTKATATGISGGEGNDVIENRGAIDVYAHTWADASSDSWVGWGSPTADSTANATATAVGIDAGGSQNLVTNSGIINVSALAETTPWAKANSDVDVTDAEATSYSKSTVYGILVGDDDNIVNNTATGAIIVTAIARTSVPQGKIANAESDEVATASAQSTSSAIGIQAGKGNNLIFNDGQITVGAEVNPNSHATASSMLYTATATSKAGASADATGIKVGDGNNTIRNDGTLTVTVANEGVALSDYPSAHLDNAFAYAGGGDTSLTSNATGISAGNGVNIIENHRSIIVSSSVDADARAYANTATTTTYAEAYAGGNAKATGIIAGNGQNTIKNYGHMTVSATGNAYALGNAEEYGSAYIGSESSPGIVAEAVGISAGHGINAISNTGTLEVNAAATATAEALGDNSTQTVANSYATATGIRTADGINTVTNSGTINVTANGLDAIAVGIQTGVGNDTIANYGSINATNIKSGVSSLGIAISSGAGNDQILLMNGSETNGHINLGEGDDWLTFMGIPLVTGNVTGAAGTDTLVFDGAGSIGFTPTAFENAIKQGAGTYSVASLPTMQRIEIKGGVLQVNDNYQFSDSGFLETFVNGDGTFGQFKVNGTTELGGDLNVLKGPGPYINGATYDIIEATAVNDAFSNVMLPEPNNFVSFEMNQLPTLVQIEVNVKDFTWLARNRVEWAVANYLDRILPSATGDLPIILAQIQNLSKAEFSTALSTLSPDSYDNYTRTTYSTAQQYTRSLQYRMNNIRSYQYANLSDDEKPIILAFRGSDVGQLYNPERVSQIHGKNGLWFDAFGQWGDQDEENRYHRNGGYTGYNYFMRGATLGFDHALTDKLMAGVSVGYSRTDIDLNRNQGSGYIKSLLGSIYGSYFNKNLYIDGALSYGRNWYDNHRLIIIGPIQGKADSNHEGDLFSAYLGAGYYFDIKKWLIGPFASLQYIYLDEESFREKGAGSVSLNIDDRQTDSLVSELGVRLARIFKTKCGSLIPEVSAAWLHDFDIDDRVITSSFAGSPGASFSIKGQDVERNGATLGAGITFIHKSGLSTSLKYKGELREKYKSNAIMGELRFTF